MKLDFPALWLEVCPPQGIVAAPQLRQLSGLSGTIDAINLTDNALTHVKLSSLVFAGMLKQHLRIPLVLNFSCRDRNRLALRADLLGAAALGVEAVVALTGDRLGANAAARGVYDVDAIGLLGIIAALARGELDEGRARLRTPPPALFAGAVANPNRADLKRELELLERKVAAGARFVITQPIFDRETAMRFIEGARHLPVKIMLGILPIRNARMARYLKERIRDLRSAAAHFDRYAQLDEAQARRSSLTHSLKLMHSLRGEVAGFNLMSGGEPSLAITLAHLFAGHTSVITPGLDGS